MSYTPKPRQALSTVRRAWRRLRPGRVIAALRRSPSPPRTNGVRARGAPLVRWLATGATAIGLALTACAVALHPDARASERGDWPDTENAASDPSRVRVTTAQARPGKHAPALDDPDSPATIPLPGAPAHVTSTPSAAPRQAPSPASASETPTGHLGAATGPFSPPVPHLGTSPRAATPAPSAPLRPPTARQPRPVADRAWPVDGAVGALRPTVLRGWEPPPEPWAAGHRGVDLAARAGQPVRAAAPGRVTFAGRVAGRGVLAIAVSNSGSPPLRTTYEPVRALVAKGDVVAAGQVVGVMEDGPFHCQPGCLHWGLRRGDRYLDPLSLMPPVMLRGGPSRLLPTIGVPAASAAPSARAASGHPRTFQSSEQAGPHRHHPIRYGSTRRLARCACPRVLREESGGTCARRLCQTTRPVAPPRPRRSRPRAAAVVPAEWAHVLVVTAVAAWARLRLGRRAAAQPHTPRRAVATAASVIRPGSSAAPSSMRRTAASTTPCNSIAVSRGSS